MITSFKCKETEKIFCGQLSRKLPQDMQRTAARKLEQLNAATVLDTLRVPPGNRLEALSHDRQGQHSIRVISGGYALCGETATPMTSKLLITIEVR